MLYLKIFNIRKVVQMEELLYLGNTLSGKVYCFFLFVYYEIACFLRLLAAKLCCHNSFHLAELFFGTLLHLTCQDITHFIELCGFAGRSRNDKRSTCLIYQTGIDLVDNGKGDIAIICLTPLIIVHGIKNIATGESHELIDMPHILRITLCQVVIYCYNMDTLALKCIKIYGQ